MWKSSVQKLRESSEKIADEMSVSSLAAGLTVSSLAYHHNGFTALFTGPPGWAGARRELLDFVVQGQINRGRHTDHPVGRHSIQTNQYPPPPSPIFYGLDALPATQPTVSKHWRHKPVTQNQSNLLSPPISVYELFENLSSHQFFVLACIWWAEGVNSIEEWDNLHLKSTSLLTQLSANLQFLHVLSVHA